MGDSDEDYNASSTHGNNGNNSSSNNNGGPSSYNNNINKNKNRDKFHRERDDSSGSFNPNNNNNSNSYNKNNDRRNDWNDRGRGGGRGMNSMGGYNQGGGYGRMGSQNSDYTRKYTNQSSSPGHYDSSPPPHKRNKKEWDSSASVGPMDNQMYGGGYHNAGGYGSKAMGGGQTDHSKSQGEPEYPTQPPFLSFKLFLQQQSDDISDEEAIKRYNEYKIEFKKTQINNFFLEHKEEEW
jgi:hypothetical protein